MEIIPYLLDVILFVFAVYWSVANATAPKGTPSFGLFRYHEQMPGADEKNLPPGLRQISRR